MAASSRRAWPILGLLAAPAAFAQIGIQQESGTDWNISNGDLNVIFDPSSDNITSVKLAGSSTNLLDPEDSQLYSETAGTPFGTGTEVSNYQETSNYIDFWTTTESTGTSTNPITYSFHYVMFNDDPDIVCYEVLDHSATDPATSVGQGQFLARVNPDLFNNTYQYNVGPNNLGAQTSVEDNRTAFDSATSVSARSVQNAAYDLTGTGLAGNWGSNFYTKYNYSTYDQFLQATTEYGSQYAVSAIYTSLDSMTGGPTKQNLAITNDNILTLEFLSDHYATGDPNYAYTPEQGVDTTRLFGPYAFRFVPTDGESGSQLYQDAVDSMQTLEGDYAGDAELVSNGYVTPSERGTVEIDAGNSAGWSSDTTDNTVVLSDPNKSFQESTSGSQYWAQLSSSGQATITGVAPGTYRLSMYELGQWGETRVDGVTVSGGQIVMPTNLQFTPENFGTSAPIWTIGTPNRSANEFLDGHNTSTTNGVTYGGDLRQYYGNYDYWAQEQQLGNPGTVVYYATAVGSTAATNNPNDWIANQWYTFDPGIYDSSNSTDDEYSKTCPSYVTAGGGPASYHGTPWQVNFTCTQPQMNQGKYVVLSVGLAAAESSLTVGLNGHDETWYYTGPNSDGALETASDPMIRSGDAGVYQFLVFQFPTADLNAAGALDQFTFAVSQGGDNGAGVMYDALRMEITNTSAAPSTTGWYDYEYINGTTQIDANNTIGLAETQILVPEPATISCLAILPLLGMRRRRK